MKRKDQKAVNGNSQWLYGEYWEEYPIEFGEIWTVDGDNHIIVCDDILNLKDIDSKYLPDLSYTDPPYNVSAAKSFYTKAGYTDDHFSFDLLLERVISLGHLSNGKAFIESGISQLNRVHKIFDRLSIPIDHVHEIFYSKKNPAYLIEYSGSRYKIFTDISDELHNKDDEETPKICIQNLSSSGERVADFCAGRGLTPFEAAKLGRKTFSVELNKRRSANILAKLADITGQKPIKMT